MSTSLTPQIWSPDRDLDGRDDMVAGVIGDEVADYCMKMATSIWPNGTRLYCARCLRSQDASVNDMANALDYRFGLPTCCGQAMWIGDPPTLRLATNRGGNAQ